MTSITEQPRILTTNASNRSTADVLLEMMTNRAQQELAEYLLLGSGWDGYRAKELRQSVINLAQVIVYQAAELFSKEDILPKEITPGPAADGSIDVEIAHRNKQIVITVNKDAAQLSFYRAVGTYTEENNYSIDMVNLEEELAWLVS